jgi:hypothetical protein
MSLRARRPRRRWFSAFLRLENRSLLSSLMPAAEVARPTPPRRVPPAAAKEKQTFVQLRTEIYGLLLPERFLSGGKKHGAVIVSGGISWTLDLSTTKGLDVYAKQIITSPVVAIGNAEITREPSGALKRKFKVTWIEPLKERPLPPAFPGRHPIRRPPPKS